MAIALPLLEQLFMPVNQAVQWLSGAPAARSAPQAAARSTPGPSHPPAGEHAEPRARSHVHPAASSRPSRRWGGPSRSAVGSRPLRVVHIPEGRAPCGAAGRMLISGRLDEVFAELDRLVRDQDGACTRATHPVN